MAGIAQMAREAGGLGFALEHAWLIPLLPFATFLLCGLAGRWLGDRVTSRIATGSVFVAMGLAYWVAADYFSGASPAGSAPARVIASFEWLRFQEHLAVEMGVLVDPISVLLMIVVTTVSALVHLYSIGYLEGDAGFRRYFVFLNLFTASMLGLVVAPNLMQMFVCWEGVGICSFLLIGFYYQKPAAVAASKKAFIVTRFADLGFLVGMIILGYCGWHAWSELAPAVRPAAEAAGAGRVQPFDFLFLDHEVVLAHLAESGPSLLGVSLLNWALLLVFVGAAGKSAMFPLHIWLPDAMEGPTPVSALIHAATMVVAGVYLVARLFAAYAAAGTALLVVAYVGAFTCLFAAVIACTQDDIKRVLAFSTLSQLGYMMFALGVATVAHPLGYTASMFHLFTHAFFKALLFLGAGAVIHAVHRNAIWEMGGLRKSMPITHITFAIATLAIAGVPPLSGFWSKDEILSAALVNHHEVIFGIGLLVAGLTAFYMARIYFVAFWGTPRSEAAAAAHEAPPIMLAPLVVLAAYSLVAGFAPVATHVQTGAGLDRHGIDLAVAGVSVAAGLLGIAIAAGLYLGDGRRAAALARALGGAHTVIRNKFYVDEAYLFLTRKVLFGLVARPIAWFDRHVVDGGVNLAGRATRVTGALFSTFQTGQVQGYGGWLVSGVVFVLFIVWMIAI